MITCYDLCRLDAHPSLKLGAIAFDVHFLVGQRFTRDNRSSSTAIGRPSQLEGHDHERHLPPAPLDSGFIQPQTSRRVETGRRPAHATQGLGNWPDWCFLPLALVQTIVANGRPVLSPEEHKFVALLGIWLLGGQRRGSTVLTLRLSMPSGKLRLLAKFQPRCFTTCPSGASTSRLRTRLGEEIVSTASLLHLEYDLAKNRTNCTFCSMSPAATITTRRWHFPIHMGMGGIAASLDDTLRVPVANRLIATDLTGDDRAKLRKDMPGARVTGSLFVLGMERKFGGRSSGQGFRVDPGP